MRSVLAHRDTEYRALMTLVCLLCGLGFAGSVIPGVEHLLNVGALGLLALAAVLVVGRLAVRWVRERIEDRADARTAAAWQAVHAPHLLPAGHPAAPAVPGLARAGVA